MTGSGATVKRASPASTSAQGVGASPRFPPLGLSSEAAQEELLHIVRRAPQQFGEERSRWTLEALPRVCSWLEGLTAAGVWQVLRGLDIHYKRGRSYVHSPDPDYLAKLSDVCFCLALAQRFPERFVLLFQDEFSYYRQPTLAADYEQVGTCQPLARRSYRSNTVWRIVAALDALTGQVHYAQHHRTGLPQMVAFYQQLRRAYPYQEVLFLVQDNWPIHFHPDVLAALVEQDCPWPIRVPPNWPLEPSASAQRLRLPIQLLPLPTYASWTNPIEKLWRKLQQERLHLHRHADTWNELKNWVGTFLDQFVQGSVDLLRYVGLTLRSRLFGPVLTAASGGSLPKQIWESPRAAIYGSVLAAGHPPPLIGLNC